MVLAENKSGYQLLEYIMIGEDELEKSSEYKPVSGAFAFINCSDKYLVAYNKWRKQWEFPAGKIEQNETYKECAIRELYEETNQNVTELEFRGIFKIYDKNKDETRYRAVYYAEVKELTEFIENNEMNEMMLWDLVSDIGSYDEVDLKMLQMVLGNFSIGEKYNKLVQKKSGDELGVFEQYEEILDEIRNRINRYGVSSVMDFGCGTGNLCGPISDQISVVGIDKNKEMLDVAQKKYPKMKLVQGSFLDGSVIEELADIVVTSYVLHGLADEYKRLAIENMLNKSKSGRVIIVDLMFESNKLKEQWKERLTSNNRDDLWDYLESKNFIIIEDYIKNFDELNIEYKFEHVVNFTWIVELFIK